MQTCNLQSRAFYLTCAAGVMRDNSEVFDMEVGRIFELETHSTLYRFIRKKEGFRIVVKDKGHKGSFRILLTKEEILKIIKALEENNL